MGNGAKAQMKRERNQKNAGGNKNSQLEVNKKAMNVICQVCRTSFLCTISIKALEEHCENKHSKTVKECFPGFEPIHKK
ncbi:hypothetical protein FBU59_002072 [Linderina macrospora]|uniref:Uncharacterized protein n=1 Tax=Linderina macrospora TaxID=4868 RepID=A0ACC1JCE4_9FUNG|nr:hypothetical protein FBU59_002072 [Linderina macrospora]